MATIIKLLVVTAYYQITLDWSEIIPFHIHAQISAILPTLMMTPLMILFHTMIHHASMFL